MRNHYCLPFVALQLYNNIAHFLLHLRYLHDGIPMASYTLHSGFVAAASPASHGSTIYLVARQPGSLSLSLCKLLALRIHNALEDRIELLWSVAYNCTAQQASVGATVVLSPASGGLPPVTVLVVGAGVDGREVLMALCNTTSAVGSTGRVVWSLEVASVAAAGASVRSVSVGVGTAWVSFHASDTLVGVYTASGDVAAVHQVGVQVTSQVLVMLGSEAGASSVLVLAGVEGGGGGAVVVALSAASGAVLWTLALPLFNGQVLPYTGQFAVVVEGGTGLESQGAGTATLLLLDERGIVAVGEKPKLG